MNKRRAAILCPGPSLTATWPGENKYDIVIAVNRAANIATANYWVTLDPRTWSISKPLGNPTIVCAKNNYKLICRRDPLAECHSHLKHKPGEIPSEVIRWPRFGATVALELSYRLAATEVDCYGVDMAGVADFDGYHDGKQVRSAARWNGEREIWDALTDELTARGVKVRRFLGSAEKVGEVAHG